MVKESDTRLIVEGRVTETFANGRFAVRLETGISIQAYASGKMQHYRVRVVPGDSVSVELSPYDLSLGRIIRRARDATAKRPS